ASFSFLFKEKTSQISFVGGVSHEFSSIRMCALFDAYVAKLVNMNCVCIFWGTSTKWKRIPEGATH
ncbi:hypothetical protein CF394_03555, partial [Tetzosporium hominis]